MAKLAVSVTVTVIFFLFAFSHARIQLLSSENEVSDHDRPDLSLESDSKSTLRLPSQKKKFNLVFVVEPEDSRSEIAETKSLRSETKLIDSGDDLQKSVTERPLTYVRFRPVNRHFRRGCRHHRNKQLYGALRGGEISYGNDMLVAGEKGDSDPEVVHGGLRHIPANWIRFNHQQQPKQLNAAVHGGEIPYGNDMLMVNENGDTEVVHDDVHQIPAKWIRFDHHHHRHHDGVRRFPFGHHDMFTKQKFKRRFHHDDEDEREENKKERVEREEGGFLKRFRKFLKHF